MKTPEFMLLHVIAALLVLFVQGCQSPDRQPKPNVILIMADDLGYGDLGCYGNKSIKTPHLDELATGGIKLTDFHSNGPVCTPTRAALLTGMYQQRTGLEGVIYVRGETRETGMDPDVITLADVMKSAGYRTAIMGKWHLGYKKKYNPVHYGFDTFRGYISGNVDYHSHYDNAGIFDWYHNTDTVIEEGYVTDLITNHSVNFIKENKDNPFFLYVAHEAPHVPFQGPNDPAYRFSDNEFTYFGPVEDRSRAYREMIESMDMGIGKIIQTVEELQLLKNTLIIFISDNGAIEEYGNNGILRGSKGGLFEGGHRVPGILFWQNMFTPSTKPGVVMSMDLFPTILGFCMINPGDTIPFDGINLSPYFLNDQSLPQRLLFWRYRNQKVVRDGDYKLFLSKKDTLLFDLSSDPGETNNLSNTWPLKTDSLMDVLKQWEKEMSKYSTKTR